MRISNKRFIIFAFAIFPLMAHVVISIYYAYGAYDGKHCAGLLDAVYECTIVEYYYDYIFGFFGLISLGSIYLWAVALCLFGVIISAITKLFRKKMVKSI